MVNCLYFQQLADRTKNTLTLLLAKESDRKYEEEYIYIKDPAC
jgi:hypothetical protein